MEDSLQLPTDIPLIITSSTTSTPEPSPRNNKRSIKLKKFKKHANIVKIVTRIMLVVEKLAIQINNNNNNKIYVNIVAMVKIVQLVVV